MPFPSTIEGFVELSTQQWGTDDADKVADAIGVLLRDTLARDIERSGRRFSFRKYSFQYEVNWNVLFGFDGGVINVSERENCIKVEYELSTKKQFFGGLILAPVLNIIIIWSFIRNPELFDLFAFIVSYLWLGLVPYYAIAMRFPGRFERATKRRIRKLL